MIKKTYTYETFDGESVTEDFYFNLSEAELMELQMLHPGGLTAMLESITNAKDVPSVIKIFKEIILRSYGEKSGDGKHFRKSDDIRMNFESSPVYSILFMELSSSAEAAAGFINGIIPKRLQLSDKDVSDIIAAE